MSSIQFLSVPIGDLRRNPWNTNRTTPEMDAKIQASLKRNGMFKPVLVREVLGIQGYEIIGGEHRWEQAVELGWTEITIANLGLISEIRAKEIGVIDNARYGADDTLTFAELLKELGSTEELQEFLPYGSSDLDAIFASSVISLDDLEIDENFEVNPDDELPPSPKEAKTHTIVRFKIPLMDAERLTALISDTQKLHGFTDADQMTNAGDALIHIISPQMAKGDNS